MGLNREDSGEMYSPDYQGEYVPESGAKLPHPGFVRCIDVPQI